MPIARLKDIGGPIMENYANLSGQSSVQEYEPYEQAIIIGFKGGAYYLYDYIKPGKENVEIMKELAEAGEGLANFVNSDDKNARVYRATTYVKKGDIPPNPPITLDALRAMARQS